MIRNDGTREEIVALFDLPFDELVYQAATAHRAHHAVGQIQLCTLLSIKTGGSPGDCGYCSQSMKADSGVEATKLMDVQAVLQKAALAVAQWLKAHPKVAWVRYAGLADDPYYGLAQKYLGGKGGAVFTFGLKGGYDAGVKLVQSVKLFSHLANIGDTRSLIIHPASTTHSQLSEDKLAAAGAGPDVVRISVGIEHIDDIIADLAQALEHLG